MHRLLQVKASGGISSQKSCITIYSVGVKRIGTSSARRSERAILILISINRIKCFKMPVIVLAFSTFSVFSQKKRRRISCFHM
jgi:hypothetical protein